MAMAGNIRAGGAYVELVTDNSKLEVGLKKAQKNLTNFGKSCTMLGRELIALGGSLTLPMALATKAFASFDDQMRTVKAVTKATKEEFESLTAVAEKLGRDTSFTAQQVAEGMTAFGRMGFEPKQIEGMITSTLNLARATSTDLGEAADITANTMRIFGEDVSQTTKVIDLLTATANGSSQMLTDLFEALKVAGPQANALDESLLETNASLGILANMGIKGSLAGTALRKSFSQFAKANIQNQLKSVGIETVDANGNLRKTAEIMADIGRVMNRMPTAKRLAFAEEIFDVRGALAGITLGGNSDDLEKFIASLKNVSGTAQTTAQEMDAGLGGSFRMLQSAVEGTMIAFGKAIEGSLKPYVKQLTSSALKLAEWIKANKRLVTTIAKVAASVTLFGVALVGLGTTIKVIAFGIGGLTSAVTALRVAITLLSAHPFVAIAAAIAMVIAQMLILKSLASTVSRQLSDLRQTSESEMSQHLIDFARLEELSKKIHLTNEEMTEAITITNSLRSAYGDLGIAISQTGNQISIAADALDRMNTAMAAQRLAIIDEQIAAKRKEIDELTDKMGSAWHSGAYVGGFYDEEYQEERTQKHVDVMHKERAAKIAELTKLLQEQRMLKDKTEKLSNLTGAQNHTDERGYTSAWQKGEELTKARRAKQQESARNEALKNSFNDEFLEAQQGVMRNRMKSAVDTSLDNLIENDTQKAVEVLQSMVQRFTSWAIQAQQEYQKELSLAVSDGYVDDDEKERLKGIKESYLNNENLIDRYRDKLQSALDGTKDSMKQSAVGAWSVAELKQVMGGTSEAERTARATEQIVTQAQRTNQYLKSIEKKDYSIKLGS